MKAAFDIKVKGRLGTDKEDDKEMRVLNRIIRISDDALLYEPDPRHVELLSRDLGLDMGGTSRATPGDKKPYNEEIHAPTEPLDDIIAACVNAAKHSCSLIKAQLRVSSDPPPDLRCQCSILLQEASVARIARRTSFFFAIDA